MRTKDELVDANSIDIENDYELQYWTSQLKVTNDELREAVKEVASKIEAVKVFLNKS